MRHRNTSIAWKGSAPATRVDIVQNDYKINLKAAEYSYS